MQRTLAASCGGGVGNSVVSGGSSREAGRTDSSFLPSNFPPNSRRSQQLTPYKLRCDKEPLSCRLGPPDFYPQTPNCPEEALNKEVLQSGYRETVDGLEECRDISATYVAHLPKPAILHCKESIRRRLRAINESRALKRKAGQVYGVPLSGSLLTKPGVFPEQQRHCAEESRRKWIESLSQQHKRLRLLSDHVPPISRKRSLFEVLIKHNVPILRATWFIKVTYLNQVRSVNSGVSPGGADRPRLTRTELWTKDVIEYLQYVLDELLQNEFHNSVPHGRDQPPQTLLGGFVQQKGIESMQVTPDGEEPSLHFKWLYMVRIVRWHYSEGLLLPSHIVEWVLHQLQEKESFEALQLLLPIAYDFIECIALSQSYVRMFGDVAVRILQEYSANGLSLAEDSQKACIASMLVELLRYLILTVPDTFVSLDYFPLPSCVYPDLKGSGSSLVLASDNVEKTQSGSRDCEIKIVNAYHQYLSFDNAVSSVQKRAAGLAKAASPSFQDHGEARVAQTLDKAVMAGDVRGAYNFLFENLSIEGVAEGWIAEVSPCLRSCLKWIGCTSVPEICACFFLFEWATCDFRDCRSYLPSNVKFTGTRDFSQIYFAVSILQLKMEDIKASLQVKSENVLDNGIAEKKPKLLESHSSRTKLTHSATRKIDSKFPGVSSKISDVFVSPGPLHDIVVSWLDQHEVRKGQGAKRVQALIMELIRHGIFYPQAYVRQLIVSGIMDRSLTSVYSDKQKRHTRLLKQLPAPYLIYALKEAKIADMPILVEAISIYSNERRLILHGILSGVPRNSRTGDVAWSLYQNHQRSSSTNGKDAVMAMSFDPWGNSQAVHSSAALVSRHTGRAKVQELKEAISALLHLPDFCITFMDKIHIHAGSEGHHTRYLGSVHTKTDVGEVTPGCEECRKLKRQKLNEERSPQVHGFSSYVSDDEDMWWARKGTKLTELNKIDQPVKPTKQSSRGRQKIVRRTQSLAQLAAARIEGSQGASSSHVCDHRISCLHHRNGVENEFSREGTSRNHACDIVTLGKTLKQLCLLERWAITSWLTSVVRELIEGGEKVASKVDFGSGSFSSTSSDKSATRWKLTEDELSSILYLLDVSFDLISVVKLLLWLLPRASFSSNPAFYGGRSTSVLSKSKGASCELGEGFLLACLQRYENVLVAANLLPEALNVAIQRAMTSMPSSGRISSSPSFVYARSLLKKYGSLSTVSKWEKDFKVTCDQKLLSELDAGDLGYAVGLPAGVEDFDDYFRQKVSGRLSRVGTGMKDMVQRHMGDVVNYVYGKERRLLAPGPARGSETEKWDDLYQTTQHIVSSLMDCIRQSTGASQDGDPAPVAAAVSALVGSVGISAVNILEAASTNSPGSSSAISSFPLNCVRRIIQVHISCLCLLRDALGDRHGRVFETALATEASNAVAESLAGKASRSQFHLSSETVDSNSNLSSEMNSSTKAFLGRPTKVVAAVSALLIGLVVHGVISLERMVSVLKVKERLDFLQFIKHLKTGSNGISRSMGAFKVDISIEICLHWFRLLVGNCRTVLDGLVADFLGESSVLALSRMQRLLPLNLVFPPAYSIFAMVIWRPYIFSSSVATREDVQLYQSLSLAIGDAIKHLPFRETCLQDTHALYALLASDASDSEFAAILELQNLDKQLRTMAFVPLRARLFLNAILDCKMPQITTLQDGGSWSHGYESKVHAENEAKLLSQLVHVLDTLQPAKFHWQWVELRLLLNEQVLIEKIDSHNLSLAEAIRYLAPNSDNCSRSENEDNFTQIVLTRLLVRPDAASLYSEVIHLLGKSLEDSLLMNAKWFLGGNDVLLGRKSIRQRLKSIAENMKLSTKVQSWRPWGWLSSSGESAGGDKRKLEATSLEEGEVVDEGMDAKKPTKQGFQGPILRSFHSPQKFATEKALAELMLPCLDRSSMEFRNSFAIDLIKQMNTIEQQIVLLSRGTGKQAAGSIGGTEGVGNKGSARKGIKGGSPGLGRRSTGAIDNSPVSAASLRASMSLRMQFLLRLLPIIYVDREPSNRNMRHMLASVLLRLSGTRIVHEDGDFYFTNSQKNLLLKRETESSEASVGTSVVLTSESLFDCILCVLHGLLSSYRPSWLRPKPACKITSKPPRDVSAFDREVAESMQSELDNMQLPQAIRLRLQAAMPMLPASLPGLISSQPTTVSVAACVPVHAATSISGIPPANAAPPRNQVSGSRPVASSTAGKSKAPSMQDPEVEIDTWTLLEDGTGCAPATSNSNVGVGGDNSNLKACSWLRGAVRVRRTDLTYVGAVDDDT
ncbi:Mediator of RNA polymerase II transcription subunit 12 [Nymphaea thermarum]|nr:Mediator of RNA polymerase II transcription subunit 12 [Nymphaea thermarum]